MIDKEQILEFVRKHGPLIPIDIKREYGLDTTLLGAVLSELSSSGLVKVSNVKRGGSPFYYVPGQEEKLVGLVEFLNEKDRRTFELLKREKILFDDEQEPLVRVSLRQIKDFARPLEINFFGRKRLLWKFFLVSNSEVESFLKEKFKRSVDSSKLSKESSVSAADGVGDSIKKFEQKIFSDEKKLNFQDSRQDSSSSSSSKNSDDFVSQIRDYLSEKNIEVLSEENVRKGEVDFVVNIPTALGKVKYFCRAKSKKNCNDGNLSSAYVTAQSLNLPVLFLTTGKVTKKAKEMVGKEFKGLILKEI